MTAAISSISSLLALTVSWDPTIRGILVVAVGVGVLMGSVYLLLATNTGIRLGLLIALAGFMGWMSIMGLIWWVYGIGLVGENPSWRVTETVNSEDQEDISAAALEEVDDLSRWRALPAGGGDAAAAADEALAGEDSRVAQFESATDYVQLRGLEIGGKDPDSFWTNFPGPHPPHYAVIQVQQARQVEVDFGETPPTAEADPSAEVVSVVMVRDLGNRRLPPAAITVASLLLFGVLCNVMHRRDKLTNEHRELARVEADAEVPA